MHVLQVLGALVTHIGSGISYEVNSALDTMVLLTAKYSPELLPLSSYINGSSHIFLFSIFSSYYNGIKCIAHLKCLPSLKLQVY